MKITIDISPEEVIELTKGNTELLTEITARITKAASDQVTKTLLNNTDKISYLTSLSWWTTK